MDAKRRADGRFVAGCFVLWTVLVIAGALLAGCGASVPNVLRQGAIPVCSASSAGYRALDKGDELEQLAIRRLVCDPKSAPPPACVPDADAAQKRLDAWLPKYKIARTVLDEADDQCELAATTADRIEAHQAVPPGAPADASVWVIDLLALVPRIAAALADLGITLPSSSSPAAGASPSGGAK